MVVLCTLIDVNCNPWVNANHESAPLIALTDADAPVFSTGAFAGSITIMLKSVYAVYASTVAVRVFAYTPWSAIVAALIWTFPAELVRFCKLKND